MLQFHAPLMSPPDESNAWAVTGRFSATGRPLLAGDPHLAYSLPGLWDLVRIERPDGVWGWRHSSWRARHRDGTQPAYRLGVHDNFR
jgi:hypothetical protein